jgi:hypothetical protein
MPPVIIAAMHPALIGAIILVGLGLIVLFAVNNAARKPWEAVSKPAVARTKQHWLLDPNAEGGSLSWHIGQRTVSVGRAAGNFVQVKDSSISRVHCQLQPTLEGLKVVDMTSSNGTIVNGEPVQQHLMKDGDVLTVGDRDFVYRAEGDFGTNAGFSAKAAGRDTETETVAARGPTRSDSSD